MAIEPTSIEFTYTKGTALPPYREMQYQTLPINDHTSPANGQKYEQTNANWVSVAYYTDTSFKVRTNSNANNLSVGTHSATVEIFQIAFENNIQVDHSLGSFQITVHVQEGATTTLSPTLFNFTHDVNEALPDAQLLNISTWRTWNLQTSTSWLQLSQTSGTGDKSVEVRVVSNLGVGTHHGSIGFHDGRLGATIQVKCVVTETIVNELIVSPENLSFQYVKLTSNPITQTIELTSSYDWTIIATESWINIPVDSGNSGTQMLEVGVKNLEALAVGEYNGTVTVHNGVLTKVLSVSLLVIDYLQNFPSPNDLHFTDDENLIQVATSNDNSCLKLLLNTNYDNEVYHPQYKVPFFKGISSQTIGRELANIIGVQNLMFSDFYFEKPYNEILVNIDVAEVNVFNGDSIVESTIEGVTFLKGESPKDNVLSEVGKKHYLTNEGIVSFSVLNLSRATISSIVVSGAVNDTIAFPPSNELFYSFRFSLKDYNLKVGDSLSFTIFNENIKVIIREKDVDSTIVFWENKWGCFDSLEFTGEYKQTSNLKRQTANYVNSYKTTIERTLDVDKNSKYDINTGWIYSQTQIDAIHNMLQSRNIYLFRNGQLTNVVPKTRNILLHKSKESSPSRKLTFINAEK